MANKNKKIAKIADSHDDDPTAEFEIIPTLVPARDERQKGEEVGENTCDLEEDAEADTRGKSRRSLKRRLKSYRRKIEELEFEGEQLKARRRGLEEELSVRVEISEAIKEEAGKTKRELEASVRELRDLADCNSQLQSALKETNEKLSEFEAECQVLRKSVEQKTDLVETLEAKFRTTREELADLKIYIEGRRTRWDDYESQVTDLQSQLSDGGSAYKALEEKYYALARENSSLRKLVADGPEKEVSEIRTTVKKLERDLESKNVEIERISNQRELENVERDTIREQLANRSADAETAETELETRNEQIDSLRYEKASIERNLRKARNEIGGMRASLASAENALTARNEEIERIRRTQETIEEEQERLRSALCAEQSARQTSETAIAKRDEELASLRTDNEHAEARVAALRADLETQVASREASNKKLATRESDLKDLREKKAQSERCIAELNGSLDTLESELESANSRHVSLTKEIESLTQEKDRRERVMDELRRQITDQESDRRTSQKQSEQLHSDLDVANTTINELATRLKLENERAEDLAASNSRLKEEFTREVRQMRLDLTTAKETITDQETINEQLASDLIDNQGFRQALESRLGELENENEAEIQALRQELEKSRSELEAHIRKLAIKDRAIADLMAELANRDVNGSLQDDVDDVLKKIEENRPATEEAAPGGHEKHRTARLLIGKADGRELRFPLFKNRLTIGRNAQNDIQLNRHFISRRHAVIATDGQSTRIIDWGSKNGVFVNMVKVTEKILRSGDVVTIGTTDFRYEERQKR